MKPKYTYKHLGHVFTLVEIKGGEIYSCADRWNYEHRGGKGPDENEFVGHVIGSGRNMIREKNHFGTAPGVRYKDNICRPYWVVMVDHVFQEEENEFGVVSP